MHCILSLVVKRPGSVFEGTYQECLNMLIDLKSEFPDDVFIIY